MAPAERIITHADLQNLANPVRLRFAMAQSAAVMVKGS
jgi:hypothetical protein